MPEPRLAVTAYFGSMFCKRGLTTTNNDNFFPKRSRCYGTCSVYSATPASSQKHKCREETSYGDWKEETNLERVVLCWTRRGKEALGRVLRWNSAVMFQAIATTPSKLHRPNINVKISVKVTCSNQCMDQSNAYAHWDPVCMQEGGWMFQS